MYQTEHFNPHFLLHLIAEKIKTYTSK